MVTRNKTELGGKNMSIKAWWAAKLAAAQRSDENQQKIEEYSTAKIISEYDIAIRANVKKAEELSVDNDTVKAHLNISWFKEETTPSVNWVELIKNLTPEQKAEVKKLLG